MLMVYMYVCTFHYFNYYWPDFVTSIYLGFILGFLFLDICFTLNAKTNHLWNLRSWQEIKHWAFGMGALTSRPLTTRELTLGCIKWWEHTQRKPLEYKTWHHPTTSSTLCKMPHLNNKRNRYTNPIISKQEYHLTQPFPSEEKQTNKQKFSANFTLYEAHTNTEPILGGQKPKGRKNSNFFKERVQHSLKTGKRRPQTQ